MCGVLGQIDYSHNPSWDLDLFFRVVIDARTPRS